MQVVSVALQNQMGKRLMVTFSSGNDIRLTGSATVGIDSCSAPESGKKNELDSGLCTMDCRPSINVIRPPIHLISDRLTEIIAFYSKVLVPLSLQSIFPPNNLFRCIQIRLKDRSTSSNGFFHKIFIQKCVVIASRLHPRLEA